MDAAKLRELVEKKRQEGLVKAEEAKKKEKERYESKVKKIEEKAASIEIDETKLARAVEIETQMKALAEEMKGLGLKTGRTMAGPKGPRPKSISGKYPSIRALAEEMFDASEGKVTADELITAVKSEFTDSRITKNDYNWLKNKILYQGEWKTREVPAFVKVK